MTLCFLTLMVLTLCGLIIRQLGALTKILPAIEQAARSGMSLVQTNLLHAADTAPQGIRALITQNVTDFFSDGSAMLDKVTGCVLGLASGILGRIPDGALGFGTGIISSYMISAKLPQIKTLLSTKLAAFEPWLEALKQLKISMLGWLKAQFKLSAITFLILLVGFFLLRVRPAPLCAFAVALVDAFPVLGTGTVLIPWSLIVFLQGNPIQAVGLAGLYLTVMVIRSVLEPKLIGKQLGLDPLATLIALYAGYRLWGIAGMILAPILAVAATEIAEMSIISKKT